LGAQQRAVAGGIDGQNKHFENGRFLTPGENSVGGHTFTKFILILKQSI
jgi:hypothetical protein